MLEELSSEIESLAEQIEESWRHLDPEPLGRQIEKLEAKTAEPGFWQDREKAEATLTLLKRLTRQLEPWQELRRKFTDLRELFELAGEEGDQSLEPEIRKGLNDLQETYGALRVRQLMSEENDLLPAFLTIHSGAGGTEACDWVSMLLRMYTRWAELHGFSVEIIDLLEVEGGIKSVTLEITGEYAFGLLKGESGIHRLVRISPFDASRRRHTSFASVFASPVIEDDIVVEIKPDELRIDTYRSSGAGGQHVNKTDSAVRITHLPTGIVVQCQNERSQHKNKATAMKVLRSRLYELYQAEQESQREKNEPEKKEIAWGNQIRSYVFQPYTMVKDHRTKHETGNVQAVMDGDIEPFIESYLLMASQGRKQWVSTS
ncbi:MAG: peptide chain release factor 2 [Spirochaetales bacterium]|nr:peptide chain release factor 2 [Spirochaetales bacterium]